mmetsp:Transcript_20839/g.84851  ORF Transcript_20839/g.84851 Transcript_20839/m.84851 type:complete len:319 (-) Transcript_20839:229-1185(-)
MRLFTFGRDGIDFVDEDNGWRILFRFFECLSEVAFGFTGHLRHDLRAVDQEEEGSSLIGNCTRDKRLSTARRSEEQNSTRRLDTDALEKLRVTQRELDQLTNLCQLLPHSTNVIVPDVIKPFFILPPNGITLAVDDRIGCDNAIFLRIGLHNLELHGSHTAAHCEGVPLANRAIGLQKVRLEVDVEQISGQAFGTVLEGENVNAITIFHIWTRVDGDNVAKPNSKIVSDDPVHANLLIGAFLIDQYHANSSPPLLPFQEHCISSEELKLLHLRCGQCHHRILIIGSLIHHQSIRGLLLFKNRRRIILFRSGRLWIRAR